MGSKLHVKHRTPQITGPVLAPGTALGLQAIAFIAICVTLKAG